MRRLTPLVLLMIVIGVGCSGGGDDPNKVSISKSDAPAQPVKIVEPVKLPQAAGARAEDMVFSGAVEAQRTTSVATRVGGLVRKVHVTEGEAVKKNQLLVEISSDDYRMRVDSARATLDRLQAQVNTIKIQHDRAKQLLEKNAIPQSDFDTIDGQYTVALAGVKEAEVGLRMARSTLSDSQIRAPYDGVVTNVAVAEGSYASPGPSALVTLEESGALRVRVQFPERYISQIKVGTPLRIRFLDSDKELTLPVTHINPSINPRSRSFSALAEVENTDLALRAGMFVEARLGEQKP